MLFPLSQQNENGIQAQEMWQLSQYLQVNIKQCIILIRVSLLFAILGLISEIFTHKKFTCLVVILMIKFNFSLPLFLFDRMRSTENKCWKTNWQIFRDLYQTQKEQWRTTPRQSLMALVCVSLGSLGYLDGYALHVYCNLNFEVAWTCIFAFSFSVICSRGQIAVKIRDFGKPAGNSNKGKVWSTMCSQQTFDV